MAWNPLTAANVAVGKFLTTTIMGKIKDCLEYLYGLTNGTVGTQILNGSFELDSDSDGIPDNWTTEAYAGGTVALETTSPDHGTQSIKFVHPGGASNGGGYADSDYWEVSELETLAIRFIHWATAAGMKNKVQIRYFTKAKVELGAGSPADVYNSTTNPTSPTQYIYQFTPPATSRYIKVRIIGGYTDTNVAGTAYFDGIRIDPAITQSRLKTSYGAVSITGGVTTSSLLTLPGGEYGFYPQTRLVVGGADGRDVTGTAQIYTNTLRTSTTESAYATRIYLTGTNSAAADSWGMYAQQRYVTSSGEIFWIFILRDKKTKEVLSIWIAPDHPCFGNGGKPKLVEHPFGNFSKEKQEIIVINPTQEELAKMEKRRFIDADDIPDRSLIDVIIQDYEINEESNPQWPEIPITIGLPLGHDWTRKPDGTPVNPIKKIIPKPDYITTKTLRLK